MISKKSFPKICGIGDFVEINGDQVIILKEDTEKRRKEIKMVMDELWED